MTVVKTKTWHCNGCSSNEGVLDQRPIQFQDEGVDLGTEGTIRIVNFVGANVEAVRSDNTLTITTTGGGGTSFEIVDYTGFQAGGGTFPPGAVVGSVYRIIFADPDNDSPITTGGATYSHNTIIYKHASGWLSWSGSFGT